MTSDKTAELIRASATSTNAMTRPITRCHERLKHSPISMAWSRQTWATPYVVAPPAIGTSRSPSSASAQSIGKGANATRNDGTWGTSAMARNGRKFPRYNLKVSSKSWLMLRGGILPYLLSGAAIAPPNDSPQEAQKLASGSFSWPQDAQGQGSAFERRAARSAEACVGLVLVAAAGAGHRTIHSSVQLSRPRPSPSSRP